MSFFSIWHPDPLLALQTHDKLGSLDFLRKTGTQVGNTAPGTLNLGSLTQAQQTQPGSATFNWQQMMQSNPQAAALFSQLGNSTGLNPQAAFTR